MTELTQNRRPLRAAAVAVVASLSLLLTGCFITPGKFSSELVLGEDDSFTFTYDGEIFFLGLAQMAQMGSAAEEFEPETCYVDSTFEERECTTNEIAGQRAAWEAGAEQRAQKAAEEAEQMSAMLGGIDPSDPEAVEKFTSLLLRQKGWNKVQDKGDGVFDVSYRLEGKLTHDFMFPVIEGVPSTNPFVQILLRDDKVARINAPGFAAQNDSNPVAAMFGGLGALSGLASMSPDSENKGNKMPDLPSIEGTFTIRTANGMAIKANNTDEGPANSAAGEVLTWNVTPTTTSSPTALIDLAS